MLLMTSPPFPMTAPTVKEGIRILIETVDEAVLGRGSKVSRLLGEVMAMAEGSWLEVSLVPNSLQSVLIVLLSKF